MLTSADHDRAPAWNAVYAMTLGIFGLVGAEFLPASLLTPMSRSLHVTEGMAGQSVTFTAMAALFASLLTSVVSGGIDRRKVLIFFTALLVASNLVVAGAPALSVVLGARVLLGVALGGFWALSAATMMRLVPEGDVAKALAILFTGVSAATVCAAPFGSFLEVQFGWRIVFLAGAGLGVVALLAQALTLPTMRADTPARLTTLVAVLRRPGVGLGMLSVLLVFAGHFAFFTYLRPFLETVTLVGPMGVTAILLLFGIGSFAGNAVSSKLIDRLLPATLASMPFLMAVAAVSLSIAGGDVARDSAIVAVWGVVFGIVPVSWSTWVIWSVPDQAESAGGLLVATCSLAITLGAAGGGWLLDTYGVRVELLCSAGVLMLAFLLISMILRQRVSTRSLG